MKSFLKTLNTTVIVTALATSSIFTGEAIAATQGTLGATSTGSVNISVTKPAGADINGLTDLTLSSWTTGMGAQTLSEDVCVYSTRANGKYTIKATGSGASSAFTLANGSNLIPYAVSWDDSGVGALASSGAALTTNVTSGAKTHAARDSATCNGASPGATARLFVDLASSDLEGAVDGTYAGTLTMLITPN